MPPNQNPTLNFQVVLVPPANVNQVRQQIIKGLGNINTKINLGIDKGSQQSLDALNRKITNLRQNLAGINQTATSAAAGLSRIGGSISSFNSNVAKSSGATTKLNTNLKSIGASATLASNSFDGLSAQIALSAKRFTAFAIASRSFISIQSAFERGVSEAIKYQKELVRLEQVGADSASTIAGISKEVRNLSTSFGVSSQDIVKASVTLRQAGLSADQVRKSLAVLAKSTLAPNFENITETTEGFIAIQSQFSQSAKEVEKSLSKINSVASKYAVESADLITGIQKTGAAFKAAGGNIEELIGVLTAVRSTTRESADTIATGLRTIVARTQRLGAIKELEQLGISLRADADDAKKLGIAVGDILPVFERFQRLSAATASLSESDPRFAQIVEIVGGIRQLSKTIPLLKEFDKAIQARNDAVRGGNSIDKDATLAQKQLEIQIVKLTERFNALFETFGKNKDIQNFVKLIVQAANAATALAEKLEPIAPLLLAIGAAASIKLGLGVFNTFKNGIPVSVNGGGGGSGINISRRNKGGIIPGPKNVNRDIVPAMIKPGSYILRKEATKTLGYANGGLVPALLTPGEMEIDPETARQIGYGNLDKLNAQGLGGFRKTSQTDSILKKLKISSNPNQRYAMKRMFVALGGDPSSIQNLNSGGRIKLASGGSINAMLKSVGIDPKSVSVSQILAAFGAEKYAPKTPSGKISGALPIKSPIAQRVLSNVFDNFAQIGTSVPQNYGQLFAMQQFQNLGITTPKDISKYLGAQGTAIPTGKSGKPLTGAALLTTKINPRKNDFTKLLNSLTGYSNVVGNFGNISLASASSAINSGINPQAPLGALFGRSNQIGAGLNSPAALFSLLKKSGVGIPQGVNASNLGSTNIGSNPAFAQAVIAAINSHVTNALTGSGTFAAANIGVVGRGSRNPRAASSVQGMAAQIITSIVQNAGVGPNRRNAATPRTYGTFLNRVFNNGEMILPESNVRQAAFRRGRFQSRSEFASAQDYASSEVQRRINSGERITARQAPGLINQIASQRIEDRLIGGLTKDADERAKLRGVYQKAQRMYEKELDAIQKSLVVRGATDEAQKLAATKYARSVELAARFVQNNQSKINTTGGVDGAKFASFYKLERSRGATIAQASEYAKLFADTETSNLNGLPGLPQSNGRGTGRRFRNSLASIGRFNSNLGNTGFGRAITNPLAGIGVGLASEAFSNQTASGAGAKGAFTYGGAGLALGSFGGPLGAAAGGLAGALYGAISAVNDFKKSVSDKKFNSETLARSARIRFGLNADGPLGAGVGRNIETLFSEIARKSRTDFVGDPQGRIDFLKEQSNAIPSEEIIRKLISSNKISDISGLNGFGGKNLINAFASINNLDYDSAVKEVEKIMVLSKSSREAADSLKAFNAQIIDIATLFESLDRAIEDNNKIFTMSTAKLDAFTTLIGGGYNFSSPVNNASFTNKAQIFGNVIGGDGGNRIAGLATGFDTVEKALPGIIRTIGASGGTNFEQQFLDEINKLGVPAEVAKTLENAFGSISDEILKTGTDDIEKSIRDLLNNAFPNLKEAIDKGANAVGGAIDNLVDGLSKARQFDVALRTLRGDAGDLALGRTRNALEARGINPALALSTADLNTPFVRRQRDLTGLGGFGGVDPSAIGAELNNVRAQIKTLSENKSLEPNVILETTEKLDGLRNRAEDLQQALVNLTDAAARSAASQERIAALANELDARRNFVENYITASPIEKAQINRTYQAANIASQVGIDKFAPDVAHEIFQFLRSAGDITFNNGLTGNEIKNRIVDNSLVGRRLNNPIIRGNIDQERFNIDQVFKDAGLANNELQTALSTDRSDFYTKLQDNQRQFLDGLKSTLEAGLRQDVDRRINRAQEDLNGLNQAKDALSLAPKGANLNTFAGLVANGQFSDLQDRFKESNQSNNRVTKLRNEVLGIANDPKYAQSNNRQAFLENSVFNSVKSNNLPIDYAKTLIEQITNKGLFYDVINNAINDISKQESDRVGFSELFDNITQNNKINGPELSGLLQLNDEQIKALNSAAEALNKVGGTIEALNQKITSQQALIDGLQNNAFAKGGVVPGHGNKDSVAARLTPGEFVMNKNASMKNKALLRYMNDGGYIEDIFNSGARDAGSIRKLIGRGRKRLQFFDGKVFDEKNKLAYARDNEVLNRLESSVANLKDDQEILGSASSVYKQLASANDRAGYSSQIGNIGIRGVDSRIRSTPGIKQFINTFSQYGDNFGANVAIPRFPSGGEIGRAKPVSLFGAAVPFGKTLNPGNYLGMLGKPVSPIGGVGSASLTQKLLSGSDSDRQRFNVQNADVAGLTPNAPANTLNPLIKRIAAQTDAASALNTKYAGMINQTRELNAIPNPAVDNDTATYFKRGAEEKRKQLGATLEAFAKNKAKRDAELSANAAIRESIAQRSKADEDALRPKINPSIDRGPTPIVPVLPIQGGGGISYGPNSNARATSSRTLEKRRARKQRLANFYAQRNANAAYYGDVSFQLPRYSAADEANMLRRQYYYQEQQSRDAFFGGYFAKGGIFKSRGTDTVPAMLTPGEFVMNRSATQQFRPVLEKMNTQYRADGGAIQGGSLSISNTDVFKDFGKDLIGPLKEFNASASLIYQSFNTMSDKLQTLSSTLSNLKLTVEGKQRVEVTLNGAAVLAGIMPEVRNVIAQETRNAINKAFDNNAFRGNPV